MRFLRLTLSSCSACILTCDPRHRRGARVPAYVCSGTRLHDFASSIKNRLGPWVRTFETTPRTGGPFLARPSREDLAPARRVGRRVSPGAGAPAPQKGRGSKRKENGASGRGDYLIGLTPLCAPPPNGLVRPSGYLDGHRRVARLVLAALHAFLSVKTRRRKKAG